MAASMWWTRERINRLGVIVGCCGFAFAALAWLCPARVILQGRPVHSVQFHLAIRLKAPAVWERGQLVEFAVRDLHPYYPADTPFTKVVTGVEGDRLQLDGRVFRINGTVIGTALTTDSQGQPAWLYAPHRLPDGSCSIETRLPTGLGSADCVLPAGTLFVLGVHERSFDSRYIGLVQAAEVKGRVVPLL
jgi:type IV secretory pathway protease TraF